jgi:hypothetical protein
MTTAGPFTVKQSSSNKPLSDASEETRLQQLLDSSQVRDIDSGFDFVAVLLADGSVMTFGSSDESQKAYESLYPNGFPAEPVAITTGFAHTVGWSKKYWPKQGSWQGHTGPP